MLMEIKNNKLRGFVVGSLNEGFKKGEMSVTL